MAKTWKKAAVSAVSVVMALGLFGMTACTPKDPVEENPWTEKTDATYTYRMAVNSLPTSWNTHNFQDDAAYSCILDYTEDGFYLFDYNDTKTGYEMVPSMATALPVDVTSQYVGAQWGISSGESWRAVRVSLREDLKFDNGDSITANDFVESIKLLLDPDAANYRADNLYGGQFSIVNAEAYLKAGGYAYTDIISTYDYDEFFNPENLVPDKDGNLQLDGKDVKFNIYDVGAAGSGEGLIDWYDWGYFYLDDAVWESLLASADSDGYVSLTNDNLRIIQDIYAQYWYCEDVEDFADYCEGYGWVDYGEDRDLNYAYVAWESMCFFGFVWDDIEFDKVGVIAVDDYTLDFIIEKPLSGFYLTYYLSSSMFLVHPETYKNCISYSAGVYTNSYGTSVNTYVGFGPYKLTSFTANSEVKFEKNPYWHGYTSGEHADQYQTTNISIKEISQASTRLQMFLAGQLDAYGLQAEDMSTYQQSDFTYFTEGESTWGLAINPDYSALEEIQANATPSSSGKVVNKTVLTIKEFRKALAFSVDRAAYVAALAPMCGVAKALFGNVIISDPDEGIPYRATDEAKQTLVDFWGLTDEIGAGKEYATVDEAIASVTGYDITGAKAAFTEAYDIAVADGLIDPNTDWEVQIIIGQPGTGGNAFFNNGYTMLSQIWSEAVKGTPFEGRLVFKQSQPLGNDYWGALRNNTVDVLFGVGWVGYALDPYTLMESYVSSDYQYDPGWDTTSEKIDIEIDGKILRASVYDWGCLALQGNDIYATVVDGNGEYVLDEKGNSVYETVNAGTAADPSLRLKILAAVERAVLEQYDMIPINTDATASLKSARVVFGTEEYYYGVGRGGIQYLTYKMNDADWAAYVQSQGGTLNYK